VSRAELWYNLHCITMQQRALFGYNITYADVVKLVYTYALGENCQSTVRKATSQMNSFI